MSEQQSIIPREVPKLACIAVVAIGYVAACISIAINARYGQRMSIDVDGYWLQGGLLLVLSLGPSALTSYSGFAWRAGKIPMAISVFLGASLLMVLSAWNANDFVSSQMVGKIKTAEFQQQASKEMADVKNTLTLDERKDLRDNLQRKYQTARTKEERDDAMAKLEALINRPIDLQAAGPNVTPDARSNFLGRRLGLDRETIQNITPMVSALAMVLVELFLPFIGFSGWPTKRSEGQGSSEGSEDRKVPKNRRPPDLRPKMGERAAYEDLKRQLADGVAIPSQAFLARRWGVSEPTVHAWLGKWQVVKQPATTSAGRRNAITSLNGNGRLLTQ